jgi:ATP phosphoribosyltransferase
MTIRLAIQKSGRLTDESLAMLRACGLSINAPPGRLRVPVAELPIELLFLRDNDIMDYVRSGMADVGLLGENVVREQGGEAHIVRRLGFARCRLSIAVPREATYSGPQWLQGKRIATSYPRLVGAYLEKHLLSCELHGISGSVEIAPAIGLADAVCDLVSSGSTLLSNGLREVDTVLESEAVLVAGTDLDDVRHGTLQRLLFRLDSVLRARRLRYILLNAPNDALDDVTSLLPGLSSPTIMPLARSGWSSVHSVIPVDEYWSLIDRLAALGAEGILVTPIETVVA